MVSPGSRSSKVLRQCGCEESTGGMMGRPTLVNPLRQLLYVADCSGHEWPGATLAHVSKSLVRLSYRNPRIGAVPTPAARGTGLTLTGSVAPENARLEPR